MKGKVHYAWFIFVSCCIISFVGFGLTVNTAGLFWGGMSEDLHLTRAQISLNATLNGIAGAVALLFAGTLFKKVNTKLLLSVSFAIVGFGFIACSFIQSITPFYVIKVLMGFAQQISIMISIPILLGNWFEKKLGMLFGITGALTAVGGSLFNPLVSDWILNYGWRTAYTIMGILTLVLLLPISLFIIKFKPENGVMPYGREDNNASALTGKSAMDTNSESEGASFKNAYKFPAFYLYILAVAALQSAGALVQHVPALAENFGFSLTVGASVMSALLLGAAAGKFLMGYLMDKVKPGTVVLLFALVGSMGWYSMGWIHQPWLLNGSGFASGLGQGIVLIALPLLIRTSFGSRDYSQFLSIIMMFGAISNALSVYLHGTLFDSTQSYSISLVYNLVMYAVAFLAILIIIKLGSKKTQPLSPAVNQPQN